MHNFAAGRYLRGFAQLGFFAFALLVTLLTLGFGAFVMVPAVLFWVLIDIICVTTDGKGRRFT